MANLAAARKLRPEDADLDIRPESLGFASTEELAPLEGFVGQPRAEKALEMGLGIRDGGYNIYVAGLDGMGKKSMISRALARRAQGEPTPRDWIYVNNFEQEDRPLAVSLAPGRGNQLRRDMKDLVDYLKDELPKAFREEDFSRERQRLGQEYDRRGRELTEELERAARELGLGVQQAPDGRILAVPLRDGQPLAGEQFEAISEQEKEDIRRRQEQFGELLSGVLARQREMGSRLEAEVRQIERDFAARIVHPAVDAIARRYEEEDGKLTEWFSKIKEHALENLGRFRDRAGPQQQLASMLGLPPALQMDPFIEYQVNVVVDNGQIKGAPIVVEESPNYKNLFGTIRGAMDRAGRMTTGFMEVKAGSLLRANGGYLVFDLMEAVLEPLVWKELKRTLKSVHLEYHMYDPFGVFAISALAPEPIPLDIKLVVVGPPLLYYLLHLYDKDFRELFKVKAEFAGEIDRGEGAERTLGQLVEKLRQTRQKDGGVLPLEASAVAELARAAARMAGDKNKVTAEFSHIADLAREASFWAGREGARRVASSHVRKAVEERVYRSDLIASRVRELIRDGVLLIDTEGSVAGQVNGLSVLQLGDHAFGKPSRLTASVGVGAAGIINIERESRLSGSAFDKAVLILEGYLRNTYAGERPLALSASLAMEQSYSMIEGDSATIAELLCLLSAVGRVPLRQDIAVTGSVNQWGEVQAVGGVNEKVEGFFDVCREKGLTGRQGVCLPAANVRNLVLRPDVLDAMRQGRFHVWAAERFDQVLELLGNLPSGSIHEPDSFHWRVDQRLRELNEALKEQRAFPRERELVAAAQALPEPPRDPRPGLPGRD